MRKVDPVHQNISRVREKTTQGSLDMKTSKFIITIGSTIALLATPILASGCAGSQAMPDDAAGTDGAKSEGEGSCGGEGKCGGDKKEGEGSCGGAKDGAKDGATGGEGSCGGEKGGEAGGEGSCGGEGKCGG